MIQCKTTKGGHHVWWRWREIDKHKCWYEGRVVVPKAQLTWTTTPEVVVARKHYTPEELTPPVAASMVYTEIELPLPVHDWYPRNFSLEPDLPALVPSSALPELASIGAMLSIIVMALALARALRHFGRLS